MEMDAQLFAELRRVIPCTGCALYFPTEAPARQPELLAGERRLLLPLWRGETPLAVAMLHGVRVRETRQALPLLPAVADICLDLLERTRGERTDAVTGLATENLLYARMEEEAARVREQLADPTAEDSHGASLHRLCMGLVLVRMSNGRELAETYGYAFTDGLLRQVADALRADLPGNVVAARVGRFGMAVLMPSSSGRKACQRLAQEALRRMAAVEQRCGVTRKTVRPRLCAGHAVYPQDMEGPEFALSMYEQARRFMERARLAAREAVRSRVPGRIMSFARILQEGGVIEECLGMGRVRISLGLRAKAREGQRFAVWEPDAEGRRRLRGEVVLLLVREQDAVAETLQLSDPARPLAVGQRLALLDDTAELDGEEGILAEDGRLPRDGAAGEPAAGPAAGGGEAAQTPAETPDMPESAAPSTLGDGLEGFLGHGDFRRALRQRAEERNHFVLALLRLELTGEAAEGASPCAGLGQAAGLWRKSFAGQTGAAGEDVLCGLYGGNGLVFFHPATDGQQLLPLYEAVCRELEEQGLRAACGLATYPFLQFRKGEMLECTLKALEYALLLPAPHVGICNSLALNISADRRYSQGDIFGAVEEYKLALLADEDNVLARNSLGVCMAALGRHHEARRHFLEALRRCSEPGQIAQTRYNLGTVCQQLGERRTAARYYRQCLAAAPEHLYAHLRLGQLCEESGRRNEARRFYEEAARIEDSLREGRQDGGPSLARRYLARVAARQRRGGEARELLHEALLRDPSDAASMLLMARLYLDANEDPAVAELLARKSVRLHDTAEGWQVLARALRAQDREDEARLAEARVPAS